MNRRSFLTALVLSPIVPNVLLAKEKWTFITAAYNGKGNSDGLEIYGSKYTGPTFSCNSVRHTFSSSVWKFYINGKEIESDRAVDERGTLCWPFRGSRKGDLCTAKSPVVGLVKGNEWTLN